MSQYSIIVQIRNSNDLSIVQSILGMEQCYSCKSLSFVCATVTESQLEEFNNHGIVYSVDCDTCVCNVGLCDIGQGYLSIGDVKRMLNADKTGLTGRGVTVAVLDTGVDSAHPDLANNVGGVYSTMSDSGIDNLGHGTHVAGSILNLSPEVKILSIKVFDDYGNGKVSNFVKGADLALSLGADLINYSGGEMNNREVQDAVVNELVSKGLIVVAASGNEGMRVVASPGSAELSVCVGSLDWNGFKSRFSNTGQKNNVTKPDVSVIGEKILAPITGKLDVLGCGYGVMTGSSMSTAIVSGIISQTLQKSKLNREQLEYLFSRSGTENQKNNIVGWGSIDAQKMFEVMNNG